MTLQDILTPDCTFCAVSGSSKKRILDKICTIAATKIADHSPFELLESLMAREKMGSTGIGNGIAIPHGRLNGTQQVIAIVMTTQNAIAFDAIDNRPVDIFIALFVPEDHCQEHLTTLQSIAKIFSNKSIAKHARKCQNDNELFQLIQQAG
ncbi:MAG: PTS IIA-like nitrogen regulatory protein PtsN [Colwellia sp.]|nr:PTS IIA-like nitrogen regulatory protein PtsN [Colwellia sp.]